MSLIPPEPPVEIPVWMPERCSRARVRYAAQKQRALAPCAPFWQDENRDGRLRRDERAKLFSIDRKPETQITPRERLHRIADTTLQAVYPDLENRFPEDSGFNRAFAQPLLQRDAPFTEVEKEFWASTAAK
jgi:hypothetical protein